MLAYHNDPAVKAKYVARFEAHRAADEVIQGTGFDNGRGCFVGCTLDRYDHTSFPVELGWPEWLARLADAIFEGLPKAEAAQFGSDLLESVRPGVDLEQVRYAVALGCHRRALVRLAGNTEPCAEQCRAAIQGVIDWIEDRSAESARSAAESAADSAWSAADSAVDSAAWSARYAAESARSAADSAAWSARYAAESARSAEYQSQRDDLLTVIRSAT